VAANSASPCLANDSNHVWHLPRPCLAFAASLFGFFPAILFGFCREPVRLFAASLLGFLPRACLAVCREPVRLFAASLFGFLPRACLALGR
jgi:hypothetical protein